MGLHSKLETGISLSLAVQLVFYKKKSVYKQYSRTWMDMSESKHDIYIYIHNYIEICHNNNTNIKTLIVIST
jgi:hypothetical protein